MNRFYKYWVIALVIGGFVLITISGTGLAQTDVNEQFFQETGHWVRDEFYIKYTSVDDPLLIYGLPITDAFFDQDKGRTIQYFEHAQFELHPEETGEDQVRLTPIGEFIYVGGDKASIIPNPTACKYFREFNHWICYEFMEFFESHGGVDQFGYPISGPEFHHKTIVQYFQYARLEWHPENEKGQRVLLGALGREYFTIRNEDSTHLQPQYLQLPPDSTPIESLRVFVSVGEPVTQRGGEQTYYVVIHDQDRNPVPNARVVMNITLPDGNFENFNLAPSDENGISISPPLKVNSEALGSATVNVSVEVDGIEGTAITSYFIWW